MLAVGEREPPPGRAAIGVESDTAQLGCALFAGNRLADFEELAANKQPALGMRHTIEQTRAAGREALLDIGARHLTLFYLVVSLGGGDYLAGWISLLPDSA